MEYTAKAFIKVQDKLKCRALYNDIKKMYGYSEEYQLEGDWLVITFGYISDLCDHQLSSWKLYDFIDCNKYAKGDKILAVKLFLELAKMKSEIEDGQWVIDEGGNYMKYGYYLNGNKGGLRQITPEELSCAVMNREIIL